MKKYMIKNKMFLLNASLCGLGLGFAACNIEPDESDLYTATGETVETFIQKDSTLTAFNSILKRAHLDQQMATYREYTCFAPTNEAVLAYIDSLYNDSEAEAAGNPHNGLEANSLEGLIAETDKCDSLCEEIAKYHILDGEHNIMSFGGGTTETTTLGRSITLRTNDAGQTVINDVAVITSEDNEVTNGYVHKLNAVIPRSTRSIGETIKRMGDDYSIFSQAFAITSLADSILSSEKRDSEGKKIEYTISDYTDTDGDELYYPTECKLGYTVFAETNEAFASRGINSFEDLVEYANQQYGNCAEWYDYVKEKNITVSTGTDYTNPFNALNMFIRYHILPMSMASDQLVFEKKDGVSVTESKWNYVNGGQPYDYYETMLPNTLVKMWQPGAPNTKTVYINRYQTFNTFTNVVDEMGSNHTLVYKGVEVEREDIMAFNGYIHPIKDVLVYNSQVPNGVLNERLRFESTTFLPEFINNGFRYMSQSQVSSLNGGGSGSRIAFPLDYFDNVISYTTENKFRYNVKGDFRAYQADAFQGWGSYDLAIKLPHVPTGTYEIRLFYSPMAHGGMMQFYIGTSTNVQEMTALDIPLDVRIDETDPRIGWTAFYLEDDKGVATDEAMRNRGYMRAPCSFRGHPDGTGDMESNNCRGDGTVTLRRILDRGYEMKQSKDYWFRYKNVIQDESDLKWQLDFIELVPIELFNNDQYTEDWY